MKVNVLDLHGLGGKLVLGKIAMQTLTRRSGASPARILVINVSRIGDTMLATPALRALAAAWPQAAITALGHPGRCEVLAHLPFVARAGSITKNSARLRGWLPGRRYDLALVHGFDEALVAYALRKAHRVVAFRQRDEALNRRLAPAVEPPPRSMHYALQALALVDALGIAHAGHRLGYRVTEAESAWAEARLGAILGGARGSEGPVIGLQVASFPTKAWRDWPIERFAELAQRIRARWPGAHFLAFGGAGDAARTGELAARLGAGCTVLAGSLSLRETAALMSRTHLYIGVDTGPTHLMGCFDIPLVVLYHCQSPSSLFGALEHPAFYPVDHPRPHPCSVDTPMDEISVDAVFAAVTRALHDR